MVLTSSLAQINNFGKIRAKLMELNSKNKGDNDNDNEGTKALNVVIVFSLALAGCLIGALGISCLARDASSLDEPLV